ncbi:MAG: phosphatidate cytidylyltransferase [Bacteroidales bacterium]|nr:phosphatidate cytidylyltransferase [Bacteroidales bacterium]
MFKKVLTRAVSGAVFLAVVIGAIFSGEYVYSTVFLFVAIMCLFEFFRALSQNGYLVKNTLGVVAGALVYCCITVACIFPQYSTLALLALPLMFLLFLFQLWQHDERPFEAVGYTVLGVIYIAVPLAFTHLLAKPSFIEGHTEYMPFVMLGVMTLQWTSDTFAYLTGISIGRHPLFARHSPKKSWEGFCGGFAFSVLAGFLIGTYFNTPFSVADWVVMGAIVPVTGTLGDLTESMFKRSMGLKDTGKIMPGHGGLLDRFDSLLMSTPFLLGYLLIKYMLFK